MSVNRVCRVGFSFPGKMESVSGEVYRFQPESCPTLEVTEAESRRIIIFPELDERDRRSVKNLGGFVADLTGAETIAVPAPNSDQRLEDRDIENWAGIMRSYLLGTERVERTDVIGVGAGTHAVAAYLSSLQTEELEVTRSVLIISPRGVGRAERFVNDNVRLLSALPENGGETRIITRAVDGLKDRYERDLEARQPQDGRAIQLVHYTPSCAISPRDVIGTELGRIGETRQIPNRSQVRRLFRNVVRKN